MSVLVLVCVVGGVGRGRGGVVIVSVVVEVVEVVDFVVGFSAASRRISRRDT